MSALTPASEVILRHRHQLTQRCVLFAGDLQDALPVHLEAMEVRVHTSYYQRWQPLSAALQERVQFCLLPEADFVVQCNTLIYYWPKSKQEAHFQLCHLLSLLPPETDLFIVGENRSGVRSAESLLAEMTILTKIDSARHCTLWHGRLRKQAVFDLNAWWGSYQVGDICVKTLPGVFSHRAMDSGSQLLQHSTAPLHSLCASPHACPVHRARLGTATGSSLWPGTQWRTACWPVEAGTTLCRCGTPGEPVR